MTRLRALLPVLAVVGIAACGGSQPPTQPTPIVNPPTPVDPPPNTKPAVDAITAQGRRARQPAQFADVKETIDLAATVRDAETSIDELVYQWSAAVGTFSGAGRTVTWTAPDTIEQPTVVTITLKVIENYGHPGQPKIYSQDTTATVTVALHNTAKELGDMAFRFLDEFSKPQTSQDWRDIMRDFKASACPDPGEFDSEKFDVERHYNNFFMHSYAIGTPSVVADFGGACAVPGRNPLRGDACVTASVRWDSTEVTKAGQPRSETSGVDYISAAYSTTDRRWWLCGSSYVPTDSSDRSFYSGR
jgi:hypothetical protein